MRRYSRRGRKKLILLCLVFMWVFLGIGYAYLETDLKINNNIHVKSNKLNFEYYIDDMESSSIPDKTSDLIFDYEKSSCSNGSKLYWDYDEWNLNLENRKNSPTCKLYFRKTLNWYLTDFTKLDSSLPDNLEFNKDTKRKYSFNTYITGLAYDNYYRSENVSDILINKTSLSFSSINGYGIGFPINESSGTFEFILNYSSTYQINLAFIFYTSEGSVINYEYDRLNSGTDKFARKRVTLPDSTSYFIVNFSGESLNEKINNVKISNFKMYKLKD